MAQIVEDGIILDFAKGNEVRHAIVTSGKQLLTYVPKLLPIAFARPMADSLRQVLLVLLEAVMTGVEKIFAIQFNKRQKR